MRTSLTRVAAVMALLLLWTAEGTAQTGNVRLIGSDEQSCTFRFVTGDYEQVSFTAGPVTYQSLRFGGALNGHTVPGEPAVWTATVPLLVPSGADVRVSVDPGTATDLNGVHLAPVPHQGFDRDDLHSSFDYREGPVYSGAAPFPSELVRVSETARYRDWTMVVVTVCPMQYFPLQKRLRLYEQLTVRAVFTGGRTVRGPGMASPGELVRAEHAFINASMAARFQVRPAQPLRRSTSPLSTGTWYKIRIADEGLYKLDRKFFEDLGLRLRDIDPRTIKIYNNGGDTLPMVPPDLDLSDPLNPTGVEGLVLKENPILVAGENDGTFDNDDYVLFYGRGPHNWYWDSRTGAYRFHSNFYSDENVYWLTFNDPTPGERISLRPSPAGTAQPQTNFLDRFHFERDRYNPHESGLVWLFGLMNSGQTTAYPSTADVPSASFLRDRDVSGKVVYRLKFKGANPNGSNNRFTVSVDGAGSYQTQYFSALVSRLLTFTLDGSQVTAGRCDVTFNPGSPTASAGLDWLQIDYYRKLMLADGTLHMFSPLEDGVYQYTVDTRSHSPSGVRVFDVTDGTHLVECPVSAGTGSVTFSDSVTSGQPRRYLAVSRDAYTTVKSSQAVLDRNSDLRNTTNSADYIIITAREFMAEAQTLAQHRTTFNGFRSMVVDIEDVFDEFGGGIPDPTAVRDFLRYAYYRWEAPAKGDHVSYVLLMGDGDYDYRNAIVKGRHNWIPTYQIESHNSDGGYSIDSRQVDDAFTWLNESRVAYYHDGVEAYPFMIGYAAEFSIGRIPCTSAEEADAAVEKIMAHENYENLESWRHTITLIADDEFADGGNNNELNLHLNEVEGLAEDTSAIPGYYVRRKIYLTDFPYQRAGARRVKPGSRDAFLSQINKGSVIFNYVGHGNPKQLAHEEVYVSDRDFPKIHNKDRYFLFTNFSCSFARFDMAGEQGGGERMVVARQKGVFGLLAATRAVYASPNTILMRQIFRKLKLSGIVGDGVLKGKLTRGTESNTEKFNYLGDPATTLWYASRNIRFNLSQPLVIGALKRHSLSGFVDDGSGTPLNTFNGEIAVTVHDKASAKTYLAECDTPPCLTSTYRTDPNVIFRGKATVVNGTFTVDFVAPRDISYSFENGSIVTYAFDGSQYAGGYTTSVIIDSTTASTTDTTGPELTVSFEGQNFTSGDAVPQDPVLLLRLEDSSGINVTGSMGHQIQLAIDNKTTYNLADVFMSDVDTYRSGTVRMRLGGVAIGKHTATVTAFDQANNVTSRSFTFDVVSTSTASGDPAPITLSQMMNYPNPFRTRTHFTFVINHAAADVEIRIYTISGRLIKKLEAPAPSTFGYNAVEWDGRDEDGNRVANGVYLYKLRVRSLENTTRAESIGKLMIAK